jgi:hypothetical protein
VAKRLPAQAAAAGEEDARGALVVAGDDLLEGPRADADPSGRRVDLAHRDVTAQRRLRMKCERRLKDVEKNSSERCLVNRADIRLASAELFARESRRGPCSGGA